jgi:hypothetical protein
MNPTLRTLAAAPLACLLFTGCHVVEHKDGNKENVDISTPFGGMHVKTNGDGDTSAIGLTAYPGAVPLKEGDKKDTNSANVDMSFGGFHLGVRAAGFQTADQPQQVLAFYRKDLARYGDVIECQHDKPVGTPTRTSQGLTCDNGGHTKYNIDTSESGVHIDGSESGSSLELRAGSSTHQHIVGVENKDGGTKFGLVLLDLPSHLETHDDKDSE